MTKIVLILSFIGLSITLAFGLIDPSNPIMWLASTTDSFAILRGVLMAVILGLLVTEPPRNTYARAFVGIVSVILVGWSLKGAYANTLPIMDAFLLLSVGISTGITVLERDLMKDKQEALVEKPIKKTAQNTLSAA